MAEFEIDDELVARLAKLLQDNGLSELEYAEGDRRIRVARPVAGTAIAAVAEVPAAIPAQPAAAEAAPDANQPGAVNSPMVGTVYVAPEPDADPFVAVGDSVAAGDTLLIIEAMKVMNPIRAPHAGTVRRVLVQNGAPVEYGDVLMIID